METQEEIWKPVVGLEQRYLISNLGAVKSIKPKPMLLKQQKNRIGYMDIVIRNSEQKKIHRFVHRLVAEAFIPNPNKKPQVNHIDGNKQNNRVDNLEWATSKENIGHAISIGIRNTQGERNPFSKTAEETVLKIRELYNTGKYFNRELSKMFNMPISTVEHITSRRRWKHL